MKTIADFLEQYPTLSSEALRGKLDGSCYPDKGSVYDKEQYYWVRKTDGNKRKLKLAYVKPLQELRSYCINYSGFARDTLDIPRLIREIPYSVLQGDPERVLTSMKQRLHFDIEENTQDEERESETMIKAEEIAEILTDNLRYVEVKFPNTIDKAYVYKVPNDVGTISAGDQVVVTTDYNREGTTHIVEVVAVYPNYTSVPSDKKRVKITKYIVNKIDFAPYNSAIKLEKEIVSFVETKQREAIRNQLRAAVTAEFPELLKFAQLEAPKPETPNT